MAGKLVVVPTPIGNLGDVSTRVVEALRAAHVVCAEDTRVTGKLLAALGVEGKRLERLDENVIGARAASVVQRVQEGSIIAYCSDAGMPGVSDPGLRLVAAARQAGVPVEVLPGPSAAVTAYVASGTTAPAFYFGGFFPRKEKARATLLQQLRALDAALIFYESPKRLTGALQAIAAAYPARTVAVCRELTKLHEEVQRGQAPQVAEQFAQRESVKGEIVLVIDPPADDEDEADPARVQQRASQLLQQGARAKAAAKQLAEEFSIARNQAYDLVLSLSKGSAADTPASSTAASNATSGAANADEE